MRSRRVSFGAVAVLAAVAMTIAAAGPDGTARDGALCSLSVFGGPRMANGTFFLAVALGDTVEAGAGGPEFWPPLGNRRVPEDRPIFGQRIRLHRIGGAGVDRLRPALRVDSTAVVVPWGYRADCRRIRWQESARWVEPGATGFYRAVLRGPDDWVDGRPTFDVAAAWYEPYPQGAFLRFEFRRAYDSDRFSPDHALTAEQLFDLYRRLPNSAEIDGGSPAVWRPFCDWVASHPRLAGRYPASRIIRWAPKIADTPTDGDACGE